MGYAYADVGDLASRWRPIGADERELAETLLADASAIIDSAVDVSALDDRKAALVPIICCDMVRRAMAGERPQADAYSMPEQFEAWEAMTPARKPFLTDYDKAALGIGTKLCSIGL